MTQKCRSYLGSSEKGLICGHSHSVWFLMRGTMLCCLIFYTSFRNIVCHKVFLHVIQKHTQTFGTQPHPNHPFPSSSAPWLPINISHLPEDTHRPNHPHPFHIGLRHQYLAWWSMQMSTAKTSAHHTSTLIPAHISSALNCTPIIQPSISPSQGYPPTTPPTSLPYWFEAQDVFKAKGCIEG